MITQKMVDQRWSDIYLVFTKILCGRNFYVWLSYKANIHRTSSNGFTSLYPQFESNLMSNRKVIELLLQLKSAKAHGKNYIKVKPHLVHHLLRNRLFAHTRDHKKVRKETIFCITVFYRLFQYMLSLQ